MRGPFVTVTSWGALPTQLHLTVSPLLTVIVLFLKKRSPTLTRFVAAACRMREDGWFWSPDGVTAKQVRRRVLKELVAARLGLVRHAGAVEALAAQRAGINRLIIPRRNEADIDDIPEHLRKRMRFVLVDDVGEVLDAALEKKRRGRNAG